MLLSLAALLMTTHRFFALIFLVRQRGKKKKERRVIGRFFFLTHKTPKEKKKIEDSIGRLSTQKLNTPSTQTTHTQAIAATYDKRRRVGGRTWPTGKQRHLSNFDRFLRRSFSPAHRQRLIRCSQPSHRLATLGASTTTTTETHWACAW